MEHHVKRFGLEESDRKAFSFHYGVITAKAANGVPTWRAEDPVDIRIDKLGATHLHYREQNPHYPQTSVQGLVLDRIEMFQFLNAILKHRSSGRTIQDVLHFKLKAI